MGEIIKDNKAQEQTNEVSLSKNREGRRHRRSGKDDHQLGNNQHSVVVSSTSTRDGVPSVRRRRPRRTTSLVEVPTTKTVVSTQQQQKPQPQPQPQRQKARSRSRSSKSTSHVPS